MKPITKKVLTAAMVFAVTYIQAGTLYTIKSGNWGSLTTWSTTACGGAGCACTPPAGSDIVICSNDTLTFTGNFSVGPGGNIASLTINTGGSFIVNGDVTFENNGIVTINTGGRLIVNGNFTNKNNSNQISVNGSVAVSGNASFGNGSTVTGTGTFSVGGTSSGAGTVFGNNPGCMACSFSSGGVLPVSLISFTAATTSNVVALSWSTSTETNNKYFALEHSSDGINFTQIGIVVGAGTSSVRHNYSYFDILPENGVNYYRLKQTDYDGHSVYLSVATVEVNITDKTLKIIPNPAQRNSTLTFYDEINESFQLSVYDYTGREVLTQNVSAVKGSNTAELNLSNLAPGMYFVSLPISGSPVKGKLVKQ